MTGNAQCKIVVGTDGTPTADKAFQAALDMAKEMGAELHVVSVTAPPPSVVDPSAGAAVSDIYGDGLKAAHESADATLAHCKSRGEAAGLTVECHAVDGDPAEGLVRLATRIEADHLVVGNRGMKGIRGMFPSVPSRVSKKAPCTVHLINTTS